MDYMEESVHGLTHLVMKIDKWHKDNPQQGCPLMARKSGS